LENPSRGKRREGGERRWGIQKREKGETKEIETVRALL